MPNDVSLSVADECLVVTAGKITWRWPCSDLRACETELPLMRVGPRGAMEHVEFSDWVLAQSLIAAAPHLSGRHGPSHLLRPLATTAALALGLIAVVVLGVPWMADVLIPFLPPLMEKRFGETVEAQILTIMRKPPLCRSPSGQAALDQMVAALWRSRPDGGDRELANDLLVSVRFSEQSNALSLPGGRIIILSNLIAEARNPDEMAAVIAHEIGHLAARDSSRVMIRATIVSFVLGSLIGDFLASTVIVTIGDRMVAAHYNRDAERAADAYAVTLMRRAAADGKALATILERIAKDDGGDGPLLRSHPFTGERVAAIRSQTVGTNVSGQILDERAWSDLRAICDVKVHEATQVP